MTAVSFRTAKRPARRTKFYRINAIVCVAIEYRPEQLYDFPVERCGLHDEFPGQPRNEDSQITSAVDLFVAHWESGRTVLAHCHKGHNRSVAVVAGFLQKTGKVRSIHEAIGFLCSRQECHPAPRLVQHLSELYG